MYKLLNKLFGWDYLYWQNSAAQGVSRVRVSPDGYVYFIRYKNYKLYDIIGHPNCPRTILYLTCSAEKYEPSKFLKMT